MPPAELLEKLSAVGESGYRLKRRLEQGVIPRDRFQEAFQELLVKVFELKPWNPRPLRSTLPALYLKLVAFSCAPIPVLSRTRFTTLMGPKAS